MNKKKTILCDKPSKQTKKEVPTQKEKYLKQGETILQSFLKRNEKKESCPSKPGRRTMTVLSDDHDKIVLLSKKTHHTVIEIIHDMCEYYFKGVKNGNK